MPSEHSHIMGGSTAARRINCPGSYQAEKALPDGETSEFAERGSMLHAAQELIVIENPSTIAQAEPLFKELLGQDMGFDGHEITLELVDEKLRPATQSWIHVRNHYQFTDWFIEQKVSLESIIPGAFGTADIIAKDSAKRLHNLDWKFGDGVPVPANGNMGLGFYTGATLYDPDPELQDFCSDISDTVYMHIVQPRSGYDADPLDTWETTLDWVEDLIDLAAEANEKALSKNPPLKPGPWCQWCKAKRQLKCPAIKSMASEALGHSPSSMTAVELATAMKTAKLLKTWSDDVFALAQKELEQGAGVPGYKLVEKQKRRAWINQEEAEKTLRKKKMKVSVMMNMTLKSPAQIEKADKKMYSKIEADHVIKKSPGLTVVEDTDKRPAVTSSMELLGNALPAQKQTDIDTPPASHKNSAPRGVTPKQ